MYDRIIVPLDGSALAELALAEAVKIARLTGDPLFLIRVVDFTKLHSYDPYGAASEFLASDSSMNEEEQTAREYLDGQAEALRERERIQVETGVVRGPVTRAILSASMPGDLIVMASHGRGGVSRWFLGSVAEDVVRHSEVPVLLIRAQPESDSSAE